MPARSARVSPQARPDLASLGQAGLKRRLCAQLPHIVVGPDDGIRAQTNAHGSVIIRPQLTSGSVPLASRSDFCTIGDLRHRYVPPMPSRCGTGGGVGFDDEHRRTIGLARPATPCTLLARAPRLRAWATRSSPSRALCEDVRRLLKLAFPVDLCNRSMQPKPPLSSSTTISFRPICTDAPFRRLSLG